MRAIRSLASVAAATLLLLGIAGCSPTPKVITQPTQPATSTTEASQSITATTPPATSSTAQTAAKSASPVKTEEQSANDNGKHFGYVKKVFTSGGDVQITIDYALFYTGKAAEQVAKAHHDVADNDYYIVNDNPLLRTFRVGSSATIGYEQSADNSDLTWISPEAFKALWVAPGGTGVRANGYWIWLDKAIVTKMAEQFVP
jgi:hypothetical protein